MKLWFKFIRWGQSQIEKGAFFLAPLSFLWGFVSFLKNFFYDVGLFKSVQVDCPVVSVGNLVAGGTGKTPFVHFLGKRFASRKTAVLSRGYGSDDEPKLLQRKLPFAKVYVGKDRVQLAKKAVQEGAELILLDDGFQYRKLHRDFDLVLLFGEDPFGKGHYLPRGFLRDSPKRLKQADLILVNGKTSNLLLFPFVSLRTKVDQVVGVYRNNLKDRFLAASAFPQNSHTHSCLASRQWSLAPHENFEEPSCQNPDSSGCFGMDASLLGKKVALFSGIARPLSFRKTVEDLGAIVILEKQLADHEKISEKELKIFAKKAKECGAAILLCTEKDAIKLDSKMDLALPFCFLEISLEVTLGIELLDKLIAKIDQKIDTYNLWMKSKCAFPN